MSAAVENAEPRLPPLDDLFIVRCRIALVTAALPEVRGSRGEMVLLGAEELLADAVRDMEAIARRIQRGERP